jgi:2-oxoisovalerate dehydrogenase E1 component
MPKTILIDPTEARQKSVLKSLEIPLNAYQPDPAAEAHKYGRDGLLRIYRDMLYIREFETMLDRKGIDYNHRGPAHLSIGQEASAVGQAYNLTADDFIFGSHRSHGEILAKGLSAIAKLDDEALMRSWRLPRRRVRCGSWRRSAAGA